MRKILIAAIAIALTGCYASIDDRVDVSIVDGNIDKEMIASCALNYSSQIIDESSQKGQVIELVDIKFSKAIKINQDLHKIGYSINFYDVRTSSVFAVPVTNFSCYSSQEALDKAKAERIRLAKEEAELNHQRKVELEKKKAKEAVEKQKSIEVERKRLAELKAIRDKAELERISVIKQAQKEKKEALEISRIKAQNEAKRIKVEKAKELAALKKKYASFAKQCVLDDADRVVQSLMKSLPSIHRPGAFHVENQEIVSIQFPSKYVSVAYRFKLYQQSEFRGKLGEKGLRQHSMRDTDGIHIVPFRWSTATAKCLLPN